MGILRQKEAFTLCASIPSFVPRQLALDVLHSHTDVLLANPLVVDSRPIPPPAHAAVDERACSWYEITQRIQYVPGLGSLGAGKINFTGCFHDLPWGLQTHTYAPMAVDLRNTYRVAGSLPGLERREPRELGLEAVGAPSEGLYLRADIEIECSVGFTSFVRAQTKEAINKMVARMIKRAEEMDAKALQDILEGEKYAPTNTDGGWV